MFHWVIEGRSKCDRNLVISSLVFVVVIFESKLSDKVKVPESKSAHVSMDKRIARGASFPSVGIATWFRINNPVLSPFSNSHLSSWQKPLARSGFNRTLKAWTVDEAGFDITTERENLCLRCRSRLSDPSNSRACVRHQLRIFAAVVVWATFRKD